MHKQVIPIFLFLLFAAFTPPATGQQLVSIQSLIRDADDGNVVKVPPGTYREQIDFLGKSLQVVAWDFERDRPGHPFTHVIAPPPGTGVQDPSKSVVTIAGNPDNAAPAEAVLEGFTILKGIAPQGGGIAVTGNVFAEIHRCYISECRAEDEAGDAEGGGVYVGPRASCTIISSMIVNNESAGEGAGLFIAPATEDTPRFLSLVNVTLVKNRSQEGAACFIGEQLTIDPAGLCFYNNIIWGNTTRTDLRSTMPLDCFNSVLGETVNVTCRDCISDAPGFLDTAGNNFRLRKDSILIDKGVFAPPCLIRPFGRPPDQFADIDGDFPETFRGVGGDLPMGPMDPQESFVRGDVKWDFPGSPNTDPGIEDAICILSYLFQNESPCDDAVEDCEDAADANDDGAIDIADAIRLLSYLSETGPPPPFPFPEAGADETEDALACSRWGYYFQPPSSDELTEP